MKFQISNNEGVTSLTIEGQLDALTVPELRAELDKLVDHTPPQVDVDVTNLRLIDSSGVGALVSLFKRVRAQGGQVEIRGLRDQPLAIFKLLRLDRVMGGISRAAAPTSKTSKSRA